MGIQGRRAESAAEPTQESQRRPAEVTTGRSFPGVLWAKESQRRAGTEHAQRSRASGPAAIYSPSFTLAHLPKKAATPGYV